MEIDRKELLYRSLQGQYLLKKGPAAEVVSNLCGLQAQFAQNPRYALQIRAEDYSDDNWSDGFIKIWSHRGTMHLIRADELGLFLSARSGEPSPWNDNFWGIPKEVMPYWSDFIRAEIAAGNDSRDGLKAACRQNGMEEWLMERIFYGWGGLIKEMCDRGLIALQPGTEKRFLLPEAPLFIPQEEARLEILRRYFRAFSPATLQDCAAFTGYGMAETKRLFAKFDLPLKELTCEGKNYFYLEEPVPGKTPGCLWLAGFDQLLLAYKDRNRIMDPEDREKVITCSGILFPVILLNGRLRARWKKSGDSIAVTPFRPLSDRAKSLIDAAGKRVFGKKIKISFEKEI